MPGEVLLFKCPVVVDGAQTTCDKVKTKTLKRKEVTRKTLKRKTCDKVRRKTVERKTEKINAEK
jgi:hypothetical protein